MLWTRRVLPPIGRVRPHARQARADGGVPISARSCLCLLLLGRTALAQAPTDAEPQVQKAEAVPPEAPQQQQQQGSVEVAPGDATASSPPTEEEGDLPT